MPEVIATRRSTAAIVQKSTEGDLRKPTSGSQFVTVQPDYRINPNFETVENVELKDDIMSGKTIITGEAPSATYSHYFKGSGTAGTAPEIGPMIQSSFGGFRSESTETTAASSSTKKLLKMSSSDAGKLSKGDALLIKDTGGFQIRPVSEVDGTDVKLGFELPSPSTSNSKVGQFVTYYPTSDNQPVFDLWHYLGGGDAGVENVKDCRTTNMTVQATAKDLINSSFSFEGTAYRFNEDYKEEFVISSNSDRFEWVWSNSGTRTNTVVTLTQGTYTNGAALATELQKQVRKVNNAFSDATVTFGSNKFTFADSTTKFYINFAGYSSIARKLGFAATDVSSASLVNTLAAPNNARIDRSYGSDIDDDDIEYDDTDPIVARDQQIFIGDPGNNVCVEASSATFTFGTPKTLITSVCTESGNYRTVINQRTAVLAISVILEEDDRRFFQKFKEGDTTHFAFIGGKKASGNWKPGECFVIYGSPASITSFSITDSGGVFALDLELTCFADGEGEGSIFVSFC